MTPPDEPPSNPYDPNWPKPEQPHGQQPAPDPWGQPAPSPTAPYGQQPPDPAGPSPYPPYGQPQPGAQPVPYGQQPYAQVPYGGAAAPKHPSATTAMVLGIIALGGMFFCLLPIVVAPFAWITGGRAVKEIDANPGRYSGRGEAQAGRIMGIIGTVLLILGLLAIIAFVVFAVAVSDTSTITYDSTNGYTSEPSF